ncbi:MAG: hypothetical protein KAJ55_16740 [Anaerolineales bacterium]|nr:hypothetical protein [Anaerolineales bacterium]
MSEKEDKTRKICQYCSARRRVDGVNWCETKEDYTPKKSTCEYFRRKR